MFKNKKKNVSMTEKTDLKEKLTDIQYHVTQNSGTEPAFDNEYWNEKGAGIYVDVVSGEPLFSSLDKFDSGTGWPSFSSVIDKSKVIEKKDFSHGMIRTEVKSSSGSHLGHLFKGDTSSPNGMRYCINSASLSFIPEEKLNEKGYENYKKHFSSKK